MWKQWQTLFSWTAKLLWTVTAATKLKDTFLLGRKAMTDLNSILKSRDITLQTKVRIVKGFSSSCARSKQSILKEINPEFSLEGLLLKLKLQLSFWPPDTKSWLTGEELTQWKRPWLWDRLKAKGERMSCLDSITDSMDMNFNKIQ